MTDTRDEIQAFLRERRVESPLLPELRKAGLVAYMPGAGGISYLVMTPVAAKPDLGAPEFQLCKGTRMYFHQDRWHDMRGLVPHGVKLESLAETALREGVEELGLKLDNIAHMQALGEFRFTSASTRKEVALWLLAAKMKSADDFLDAGEVAFTTASRRWFSLEQFRKVGRADHAYILEKAEAKITACA